MTPSRDECYLLLEKNEVPEHVVQHCEAVEKIAVTLCELLNNGGKNLDRAAVQAGALLHDISKVKALHTGQNHAAAGARVLEELGYADVAAIIRQHVILDEENWSGPVREATLVCYADKRVRHTEIVSLAERFDDLKARYGRTPTAVDWLDELEKRCRVLEAQIFSGLSVTPEMLITLIR